MAPCGEETEENMVIRETTEIGGKELTIEMGKLARQADGAVLITYGETMVMVTAVCDRKPKDLPFLPLTCEFARTHSPGAASLAASSSARVVRPRQKF